MYVTNEAKKTSNLTLFWHQILSSNWIKELTTLTIRSCYWLVMHTQKKIDLIIFYEMHPCAFVMQLHYERSSVTLKPHNCYAMPLCCIYATRLWDCHCKWTFIPEKCNIKQILNENRQISASGFYCVNVIIWTYLTNSNPC